MIHLDKDIYVFKKGITIKCKLKNPREVNPPVVTYTWFSCDSGNCGNVEMKSQSLILNSLPRPNMKYQCMAKNAAGSGSTTIHVVRQGSKCKARRTLALSA